MTQKRMKIRFYKLMTNNELNFELNNLLKGCGNKVNSDGDCMYVGASSNRYCSTCSKHIKIIKDLIKDKER